MRNIFLAAVLALSLALPGPVAAGDCFDTLYQVSTIASLMDGAYDGTETVSELLGHGDFGLGTFDRLDGEMVVLGGVCYQVRIDGAVCVADGAATTPFAEVTEFEDDASGSPAGTLDMDGLKAYIDGLAPDMGVPCAVKVTGTFSYVKTRSVPPQERPYPKLTEAVKAQRTFEFRGIKGTVVGFRMPAFMEGVNVPGYHLHFITDDRKGGGHVLALTTDGVRVALDETPEFRMKLPAGVQSGGGPGGDRKGELKAIEGGR